MQQASCKNPVLFFCLSGQDFKLGMVTCLTDRTLHTITPPGKHDGSNSSFLDQSKMAHFLRDNENLLFTLLI